MSSNFSTTENGNPPVHTERNCQNDVPRVLKNDGCHDLIHFHFFFFFSVVVIILLVMSSATFPSHRSAPWRDRDELWLVCTLALSVLPQNLLHAVKNWMPDVTSVSLLHSQLTRWALRGGVEPLAVSSTRDLISVIHDPTLGDETAHARRLALSCAVARCVGASTDSRQVRATALSVATIAARLHPPLPRELVDMRHATAHGALPSAPAAWTAAVTALAWLRAAWWEPQSAQLLLRAPWLRWSLSNQLDAEDESSTWASFCAAAREDISDSPDAGVGISLTGSDVFVRCPFCAPCYARVVAWARVRSLKQLAADTRICGILATAKASTAPNCSLPPAVAVALAALAKVHVTTLRASISETVSVHVFGSAATAVTASEAVEVVRFGASAGTAAATGGVSGGGFKRSRALSKSRTQYARNKRILVSGPQVLLARAADMCGAALVSSCALLSTSVESAAAPSLALVLLPLSLLISTLAAELSVELGMPLAAASACLAAAALRRFFDDSSSDTTNARMAAAAVHAAAVAVDCAISQLPDVAAVPSQHPALVRSRANAPLSASCGCLAVKMVYALAGSAYTWPPLALSATHSTAASDVDVLGAALSLRAAVATTPPQDQHAMSALDLAVSAVAVAVAAAEPLATKSECGGVSDGHHSSLSLVEMERLLIFGGLQSSKPSHDDLWRFGSFDLFVL